MTDREMLELAAKAAGLELYWPDEATFDEGWALPPGPLLPGRQREKRDWKPWNPRDDDGDSRRLAVALEIRTSVSGTKAIVDWWHRPDMIELNDCVVNIEGGDACAALRLATLRAAAEIGKTITS